MRGTVQEDEMPSRPAVRKSFLHTEPPVSHHGTRVFIAELEAQSLASFEERLVICSEQAALRQDPKSG